MSNNIDLTSLFPLQEALDKRIQDEHHVTYEGTVKERILALLVELGEFANETRCFKFWSNKGPSPKDIVLDEYADGLHFLLSLGIVLGVKELRYEISPKTENLTEAILIAYREASSLLDDFSIDRYQSSFHAFLDIAPLIGAEPDEIIDAYHKKLGVNYKRQDTNY